MRGYVDSERMCQHDMAMRGLSMTGGMWYPALLNMPSLPRKEVVSNFCSSRNVVLVGAPGTP